MRMRAGPGKILTEARSAEVRVQAWFRPKYECWIAVPTCPFTFDLFDLWPVAMITGRITFLRPAATATGRTAQSCTRFSDQNVYMTSRSMWERCLQHYKDFWRILFCTLMIENVRIFDRRVRLRSQCAMRGLDRYKLTRTLLPRRFECTTSSSVGR